MSSSTLLDVGVATIFAREFLEAFIITGNYRTVIQKNDKYTEEEKRERLRAVNKWALIASIVAIIVVLAVAIPLGVLSKQLDNRIVEIIEGVSKVVAAVCILQLSVKIPVWLGVYEKVPLLPCKKKSPLDGDDETDTGVSLQEIRFNVSWNIWREIAECGVFLIPYFLGGKPVLIPLSALLGIAIAIVVGGLIYYANQRLTNKVWLAMFMSLVTGFLSIGLFVGGCHEFEEVWGETPKVWKIPSDAMSHKKLPMVILKPFGYSSSRTILQMACFWSWTILFFTLHGLKYRSSKIYREEKTAIAKQEGVKDVEKGGIEMANVGNSSVVNKPLGKESNKSAVIEIPLCDGN